MAEVIWSEEALATLDSVTCYIAQFDPVTADRITRKLLHAAASLAHFPKRGRPAGGSFRELPTVPPFVIRYVVRDDVAMIVRVRHGRKRP